MCKLLLVVLLRLVSKLHASIDLEFFTLSALYLINEACKAVVEALDLLLLVASAHGQAGVDLQVEGRQQALVDRQGRQRGAQAVVVPVGPSIEGAAAQGDAAEPPLNWTKTAQPPRPAAAPDRVTGADPLGTTQTHGGGREDGVHRWKMEIRMDGGRRADSGKTEMEEI